MNTRRRCLLWFVLLALLLLVATCLWLPQAQRQDTLDQQYTLNRQLFAAVLQKDAAQALALVNTGADPNTHDAPPFESTSPTAFLLACGADCAMRTNACTGPSKDPQTLALIKSMLLHGAVVNARTPDGESALHGAVFHRDADTVALLLNHGAQVDERYASGRTALMCVVMFRYEKSVGVFLVHGAQVNAQDEEGKTALHHALLEFREMKPNKHIIQQLIAHGADPNQPDKQGGTPLALAQEMAARGQVQPDIVALLGKGGK